MAGVLRSGAGSSPLQGQPAERRCYFRAHLAGAAEVPATATALVRATWPPKSTPTREVFRYKATYSGLTGPSRQGPTSTDPRRDRARTRLPCVMVSDPSSPISGEAVLTGAQISDLRKGLWVLQRPHGCQPRR